MNLQVRSVVVCKIYIKYPVYRSLGINLQNVEGGEAIVNATHVHIRFLIVICGTMHGPIQQTEYIIMWHQYIGDM
jgi:hypothetical protein